MHRTPLSSPARQDQVVVELEPGREVARFTSEDLLIGEFRCAPSDPGFATAGRIRNHVMGFPRAGVWIRREDAAPFVADSVTATLFAPGDAYERAALTEEGDSTDWFAVSEPVAREIAVATRSELADADRPLGGFRAAIPVRAYEAQRRLLRDVVAGRVDREEVEERAFAIIAAVLREGGVAAPARRGLVEETKGVIHETLRENVGVRAIAARVGASPYHLCRTFRASTGTTMHAYRRDLRLRAALTMLPQFRGRLSMLALELGFVSHAHFTAAFRRAFARTPSLAMA